MTIYTNRADLLEAAAKSIRMQEAAGIDPVCKFDRHICSISSCVFKPNDMRYNIEFPLVIVEGKPVWVGSKGFWSNTGHPGDIIAYQVVNENNGEEKMKELKEAKEAYAKLAEAIATMEAKQKDATWPKDGDAYWRINGAGKVQQFRWNNDAEDTGAVSIGNVFRTESDAQKELETRKTIAEFRAQPGRVKFVWNYDNYCASVNTGHNNVRTNYFNSFDGGFASTYFDNPESAQAAINAVGEDRLLAASKWLSMGE